MTSITEALKSITESPWVLRGTPSTSSEFNDMFFVITGVDSDNMGIESKTVDITWAQVQTKIQEMDAEYDSKQYARDRAEAYPSLADQADMQFHDAVDGTTTWQDAIQAVKDAYPKP